MEHYNISKNEIEFFINGEIHRYYQDQINDFMQANIMKLVDRQGLFNMESGKPEENPKLYYSYRGAINACHEIFNIFKDLHDEFTKQMKGEEDGFNT
jgi:hypothetical protein